MSTSDQSLYVLYDDFSKMDTDLFLHVFMLRFSLFSCILITNLIGQYFQ